MYAERRAELHGPTDPWLGLRVVSEGCSPRGDQTWTGASRDVTAAAGGGRNAPGLVYNSSWRPRDVSLIGKKGGLSRPMAFSFLRHLALRFWNQTWRAISETEGGERERE